MGSLLNARNYQRYWQPSWKRVLLPDPARPWSQRTVCWLVRSSTHSTINFKMSALVLGSHPVRVEASILTGSSFSRMSCASAVSSGKSTIPHDTHTEYHIDLTSTNI